MMSETNNESLFFRWPDVLKLTKFSRSTIERKVKAGEFPKPVQLGKNTTAWRKLDITKWEENLPEVEWRNHATKGENNV